MKKFTIARSGDEEDQECGEIQLVLGPMWGGKTDELLRRARLYALKYNTCLIKYKNDTRYSPLDQIETHDRVKTRTNVFSCGPNLLDDQFIQQISAFDVICIDEAQFFTGLVEFADTMANHGKVIIAAGLDADSNREPFGELLRLIPKAESITKLSAICADKECTRNASFSFRMSENTEQEFIGGAESYKPLCRYHYNKYSRE